MRSTRLKTIAAAVRHSLNCVLAVVVLCGTTTQAADGFDQPPIEYSTGPAANALSQLQQRLDNGSSPLPYDDRLGYLPALLDALDIPVDSQVLVFSQTSLQRHVIRPETPRAIYFNDDVYVGFCHRGDVLEISTADPNLGTVFYTLRQRQADKPDILRQTDQCLQCHQSSRTEGVPGHLVRSMFVGKGGQPLYAGGSSTVDHTTPIKDRWGGWYVTGSHGNQTHLGNLILEAREVPATVDNAKGLNWTALPEDVLTSAYPTPHSDLVAHLVLEHQVLVHNRITKANFTARQALAADAEMRKILGEEGNDLLDSTKRRIASAGEDLIEAILFVDEAPLTDEVHGTSGFETTFPARGPRDAKGRSLRDFDLKTRLFKYPCSYLVASESFRRLPDEMLSFVWTRLHEVLVEGQDARKYKHLSAEDRKAITDILQETHPDAAKRWNQLAAEG